MAEYDRACGFPLRDTLPATHPHATVDFAQTPSGTDREIRLAVRDATKGTPHLDRLVRAGS